MSKKEAKPFLRWAGGKRWLRKEIDSIVKIANHDSYHEPFVGGGAILFHLKPKKAFISDVNGDLIKTYLAIKENPEAVIDQIKNFDRDKESYYLIRSRKFDDNFVRAAQFIYLNQLSFNGIYRVNSNGAYNVPYGSRENYKFDFENILLVADFLQTVEINHSDFVESVQRMKENDLVFLDPPYTIAHNSNGFVQYNQKIFSLEDQYRLNEAIDSIKDIGAHYILTNAAHAKVKEIFDKDNDTLLEISRSSVVGGKDSVRGKYSEYLFTNL